MEKDLTEKIGFTFEPYTYLVERGKIREFALAIGDDNPIYYDRERAVAQGFRDIPIPPTFATVIDMWAGPDFEQLIAALKLNPLKVLHGEQEYQYLEEICAGDEITGKSKVISAAAKRGMKFITLETEYFNQQGKKVLVGLSTIIEMNGE
ncbi:MaoC family dehydratase N-terminal domain-containing protein [Microaerobacter geothermalis]|uniref:MaoC family dehydratase N-terminal domain-containing protein n=1 Tax=Microaerobacter geothermalis TaxID=674972 RepID=UPI001F3848C8|nr:MaoC family dehydratase N-terminal domain-containing protein [Microaerobacter geothermalis]MCF6095392.1 MaoC family dehydratase N-terminal domain-containing protein [Microaerobacter geothermalis]